MLGEVEQVGVEHPQRHGAPRPRPTSPRGASGPRRARSGGWRRPPAPATAPPPAARATCPIPGTADPACSVLACCTSFRNVESKQPRRSATACISRSASIGGSAASRATSARQSGRPSHCACPCGRSGGAAPLIAPRSSSTLTARPSRAGRAGRDRPAGRRRSPGSSRRQSSRTAAMPARRPASSPSRHKITSAPSGRRREAAFPAPRAAQGATSGQGVDAPRGRPRRPRPGRPADPAATSRAARRRPRAQPTASRWGRCQAFRPGSRKGVSWTATGVRRGQRQAAAIIAGHTRPEALAHARTGPSRASRPRGDGIPADKVAVQ